MEVQEAIQVLTAICSHMVGNLVDHQKAQIALETIKAALAPKPVEAEADAPKIKGVEAPKSKK